MRGGKAVAFEKKENVDQVLFFVYHIALVCAPPVCVCVCACVCVCMSVCVREREKEREYKDTHTQTYTRIYIH